MQSNTPDNSCDIIGTSPNPHGTKSIVCLYCSKEFTNYCSLGEHQVLHFPRKNTRSDLSPNTSFEQLNDSVNTNDDTKIIVNDTDYVLHGEEGDLETCSKLPRIVINETDTISAVSSDANVLNINKPSENSQSKRSFESIIANSPFQMSLHSQLKLKRRNEYLQLGSDRKRLCSEKDKKTSGKFRNSSLSNRKKNNKINEQCKETLVSQSPSPLLTRDRNLDSASSRGIHNELSDLSSNESNLFEMNQKFEENLKLTSPQIVRESVSEEIIDISNQYQASIINQDSPVTCYNSDEAEIDFLNKILQECPDLSNQSGSNSDVEIAPECSLSVQVKSNPNVLNSIDTIPQISDQQLFSHKVRSRESSTESIRESSSEEFQPSFYGPLLNESEISSDSSTDVTSTDVASTDVTATDPSDIKISSSIVNAWLDRGQREDIGNWLDGITTEEYKCKYCNDTYESWLQLSVHAVLSHCK